MAKRFNVYFSGQVITGFDPAAVRASLGKVFNADAQTLDKLFSGKPRMIKRDCDEATAQKYRAAMERAGAEPIIEAIAAQAASSAADKIAALAAAPEDERFRQNGDAVQTDKPQPATAPETTPETTAPAAPAVTAATASTVGAEIELAPPETDVLLPGERATAVVRDVDTSNLTIDADSERLADPAPPPPDAPDTSHLNMANAGEAIPNLASNKTPVSPNTDSLALSPQGTDLADCARPLPPTPAMDLSSLEIAPAGADVMDAKHRKRDVAEAPDTDHLSLED